MYEAPSTPTTLARYLATYLTDDSAILAHVKHRFGVQFDKEDIAKLRASLPRKYLQGQGKPSAWDAASDPSFRGSKPGARDDLLVALARYHLKHSKLNAHERAYYSNIIGAKAKETNGRAGVSLQNGRWRAHITVNRKFTHLGYFDEYEDALAARKKAEGVVR